MRSFARLACAAAVLVSGCAKLEPGLWEIAGTHPTLGAYHGQLEVRSEGGALQAIRVVTLEDYLAPDGRAVDLAWTGPVDLSGAAPILQFKLRRADFIAEANGLARTDADAAPLAVPAFVAEGAGRALAIEYKAAEPAYAFSETAAFVGPPGASPIFTSGRKVRETFSENGIFVQLRAELFDFFETFYALPEVAPFTGDPRFQRAVHSMVEERTDFDYYRANPDRLRVVNKVVDGISLAETQVRADAFRAAYGAKRDHYQAETEKLVLAHGMLASSLAADYTGEDPDGDGALWTGVYCWTQAARWKATGDPGALDEVRRTLRGILTLMDITGDPKRFARTLRLAGPPLTGNWVRGSGAFAAYDWLAGGNNDMSKGLLLGMVAGWDALPEGDPLRDEIPAHALALLDLCEFLRVRPEECGGGDSDLPFPSLNPGIAELLAGIVNDRADLVAAGLAWLHDEYLYLYPGLGGGPFYVYGISDWSGNHLTLATNLSLLWALERAGDAELLARWKRSTGIAYEQLRTLESPLHAAFGLRYAGFESASQEAEALGQALWGLRSFPFPKHPWRVDHRIRDDFVLSPWPSLPWKFDWETNPGRRQSLVGFPMVESAVDGFRWNGSPYSIADGPLGDRRYPGADYLFLYWLAREAGIIADGE